MHMSDDTGDKYPAVLHQLNHLNMELVILFD